MATFDEIFNSYANATPSKREQAQRVSQEKRDNISGYNRAAGNYAGVNTPRRPIGSGLDQALTVNRGYNQFVGDLTAPRSTVDTVRDTVVNAATGAANALGGIASIGVDALDAPNRVAQTITGQPYVAPSAAIASGMETVNEFAQGLKSDAAQRHSQAYQAQQQETQAENQRQYDQEIAGGANSFFAGARKQGRDALDTIVNNWRNPNQFLEGTAQGAGSLVAGGPVAKGASALVSAGAKALAARGLISQGAARVASEAVEKGAMTATIAAMEMGAVGNETFTEVMSMTPEELMANSPQYAQMIRDGVDPLTAQRAVATSAASLSSALQGPLAAITGRMVSSFEADVLAGRGVKEILKNIGLETLEESAQEAGSALTGNIGIRATADRTQEIFDGVGQSAAEGGLYGFGAAAGIQGPAAAVQVPLSTAQIAAQWTKKGVQAVADRGRALKQSAEDNRADINSAEINQTMSDVVTQAPQTVASVAETMAQQNAAPEQIDEITRVVDETLNASRFDPATVAEYSPMVQETVGNSATFYDSLRQASLRIIQDKNLSDIEKAELGYYISSTLENNAVLADNAMLLASDVLPENHPALEQMTQNARAIYTAREHPQVVKAMEQGRKAAMAAVSSQNLTPDVINTPTGKAAIMGAVEQARTEPNKVDPEIPMTILEHASSGLIELSEPDTATLRGSLSLVQSLREKADTYVNLGIAGNASSVALDIQLRESDGNKGPSANTYAKTIIDAASRGDTDNAASALGELKLFAEHMSNKTAAVNESFLNRQGQGDTSVPFKALNSKTREFYDSSHYVQAGSVGSLTTAQQIGVDAGIVAQIYNGLVDAYPELGAEHFTPVSLAPELTSGPAVEIAKAYRQRQDAKQVQTQQSATPQAENTPVVEKSTTVENNATPEVTATVEDSGSVEEVAKAEPRATDEDTDAGRNVETQTEEEIFSERAREMDERIEEYEDSLAPVQTVTEEQSEQLEEIASEPVVRTVDEVYPNLIKDQNGNNFLKAFKTPAQIRSRLYDLANAFSKVEAALKTTTAFQKFSGKRPTKLSAPVISAYGEYLNTGRDIARQLQSRVNTLFDQGEKGKKSAAERLGITNVLSWREMKSSNLLVQKADGKHAYEPKLLQQSVLAALDWNLNALARQGMMDEEQIGKMLGIDETNVTEPMLRFFNAGVFASAAAEDLANQLVQFWGLQKDKNVVMGLTDGIPQSMASELILSMEKAGLLEVVVESLSYTDNNGELQSDKYTQVRFKPQALPDATEEMPSPLLAFPDAISTLVLEDRDVVQPSIGEELTAVARTQLRNNLVDVTPEQQKVADREQKVPHFLNAPMFDFVNQLGKENILRLFGAVVQPRMNKNHRQSIEGRNLGIANAYDEIQALKMGLDAYADQNGTDAYETPVYYPYAFTVVNRLQMLGRYNPQSNKLMREVIMPTQSVVDLSDASSPQMRVWKLGLAQALGVKVHKLTDAQWMVDLDKKLFSPEFQAAADVLAAWNADPTQSLPDTVVESIHDALGAEPDVVAVHALMDFARYMSAADLTEFNTSVYVEADGVTDGPINAMWHLSIGEFTDQWIDNMARGGLYLDGSGVTLNSHIAAGGDNKKDLYEVTADAFKTLLSNLKADLKKNNLAVAKQASAIEFMMTKLLPNQMRIDPEKGLIIDRGVSKNPLTITVYGSSQNGIAGKVAKELSDAIYERMSNALARMDEDSKLTLAEAFFMDQASSPEEAKALFEKFGRALDMLVLKKAGKAKSGKYYLADGKLTEKDKQFGNADNFTITPAAFRNLKDNLLTLFVEPLHNSIEGQMGSSMDGAKLVQRATSAMSELAKIRFNKLLDEMVTQRRSEGRTADDFLTENEINQLRRKMSHLMPFISTASQNYLVGGTEKVRQSNVRLASSMDGRINTNPTISALKSAGVSGIPFLNIGFGDGQMIQNLALEDTSGHLYVFDGANYGLSNLERDGMLANKAVHDAWFGGNPLAAVRDAFKSFMEDASFDGLNEIEEATIVRAALGEDVDIAPLGAFTMLQTTLEQSAELAEARKAVLARLNMSIDHMASIQAPFVVVGKEDLSHLSSADKAKVMNDMLYEELGRIRGEKAAAVEKLDLEKGIQSLGTLDEASGTKVLETRQLPALLQAVRIPAAQREMIVNAAHTLAGENYKVVFGDRDALKKYAEDRGFPLEMNATTFGVASVPDRVIYLATGSTETIAHELIHASTLTKVYNAYANPESQTPEVRDAVARLEVLMNEWIESRSDVIELRNPKTALAYENALSAVRKYLFNPSMSDAARSAAALNEFMAWNLSNQDLIRIGKEMKVRSPLARIARQALDAIRSLMGLKVRVGNDLFSNIRFNTRVIMADGIPTVGQQLSDMALQHSVSEAPNERLQRIRVAMAGAVKAVGDRLDAPQRRLQQQGTARQDYADATSFAERAEAAGFSMTSQEHSVFVQMMAAMQADTALNPGAMRGMDRVYRQVMDKLTVDMLMENPESNDPNDRALAQQKYDLLTGAVQFQRDKAGRSNVLPVFIALAASNEDLRQVLSKIDITTQNNRKWNTADNVLSSAGNEVLDRLTEYSTGLRPSDKTANDAITRLVDTMAVAVEKERSVMSNVLDKATDLIDLGNDKLVDGVSYVSEKAITGTEYLKQKAKGTKHEKVANLAANIGALIAGSINKNRASEVATSVIDYVDGAADLPVALRELFNEVIGMTEDNASVVEMIKYVKTMVQQARQQYREKLPQMISDKFKNKLSEVQWKQLFNALAKTDLAVFEGRRIDPSAMMEFISDDAKLQAEIAQLETEVLTLDKSNGNRIMEKAQELADFMNTGKVGRNLLRNAYSVANLFGEGKVGTDKASDALVRAVDELKTLYAIRGLDSDTKSSITKLLKSEKDGMNFAMSYLLGQRKDELKKPQGAAFVNHFAGFTPTERDGMMIVADDKRRVDLETRGYVRVADYTGSATEPGKTPHGYYVSKNGVSSFNQGIFQNVRGTVYGVDTTMGHRSDGLSAGMITDPKEVEALSKRIAANGKSGEALMPHYDIDGKLIAYERSMDQRIIDKHLPAKENLAGSLGIWRGRQVEEYMAHMMNLELLKRLDTMAKEQMPEDKEGYTNLMDESQLDEVQKDAVRLLSPAVKQHVRDQMNNELWVKNSLINDAIGYRNASIGDVWTGVSRASKEQRTIMRDVLTGVFGLNAYQNLVKAERTWQGLMSDARVLIVVKSVIVPVANMISNTYQMMTRGIPLVRIPGEVAKKTAEITEYLKGQERKVKLEADLRVARATNDVAAVGRLERQLQGIRDMNRRLTIWPLLNAGEFTSISEGLSRDDLLLTRDNNLWDYVAKKADALPTPLKTAGRYALVTKDTALFQGLAKATAYGDFIAKAIVYDHEVSKGTDPKKALHKISDEFVNYDRQPGRTRSYLEKMGLIWFWNFKLRIMKVAAATLRENPLHLLLTSLLPAPAMAGLPSEDNLLSLALDGKLGFSVGPGQALRSWSLNPWANIFG